MSFLPGRITADTPGIEHQEEKGLSISSIGVGHSFNEDLLITVREAGRGNYYYIKNPDEIPRVFARELQGLLRVVAQGMKLTAKGGAACRVVGVLGYQATAIPEGVAVAAGPAELHKPNIEVVKQVELTRTAVAKDELVQVLDAGDLEKGRAMLQERIDALGKLREELGDDPEVGEEVRRLEDLSNTFAPAQGAPYQGVVMEASMRKELRCQSYQRRRGGP